MLALLLLPGLAHSEQTNIHYSLEKEGTFHVLYSRAASTATGAALGGLIGASIQAGAENSKDAKKEEQVLQYLPAPACAPLLQTSFMENLQDTGNYSIATETPSGKNKPEGLAVELTVDRCGFKLVNSERMFVAAFAEARYRIYDASGAKPKTADRLLILGKARSTWEGLMEDETEIPLRFERVLEKAGKRLANKVIYHR